MATSPFDILAGAAEVFVAPTGEAFPLIDADPPGGNWVSLGRTEGGITVSHNETLEGLRVDQATGPVKFIRTEESLVFGLSLAELSLEKYAKILNDVAVTDTPPASSVAGHREIPLRFGPDVKQLAMLIRGPSAYMDAFFQYEVPIAVQTGSPSGTFQRGDKTVLECEWTVVEDPAASSAANRFGKLRMQDAAPL